MAEPDKHELALEYLSSLIKNSPFKNLVYLAGGAVRDKILGKPVKDIDVVVSAPDGGIAFANWITKKLGIHSSTNPITYPRFGTAKFNFRKATYKGVDLHGIDIESVMTRGEKYTPGSRKPEVVHASLKDDVFRRDITANSLLLNLTDGKILDLTGRGMHDLKNGVIRTPLDPDITFNDDPLRMLRVVRFCVRYNWKVPFSLIKALKKNADQLKHISKERIQEEFNKILTSPRPDLGVKLLTFSGLMQHIVPELYDTIGVSQNEHHSEDVFNHIMSVVKNTPPELIPRMSALFHDIGKPATRSVGADGRVHFYDHEDVGAEMSKKVLQRLKYSNDIISSVSNIVSNHMRLKSAGDDGTAMSDKALRKFVVAMGTDLDSALHMIHADNISHSETSSMPNQTKNIVSRLQTMVTKKKPSLPVNGHDIMKAFDLKPGPQIKDILAKVEDAWFENPDLTKDDAMKIAANAVEASPKSDVYNKMVKNPETGNDIKVKSALGYEKNTQVYQIAKNMVDKKS